MRSEAAQLYSNPDFLGLTCLAREVYRLQLELPPSQHTAPKLALVMRSEEHLVTSALKEIAKAGLVIKTKPATAAAERARAYRERKRHAYSVTSQRDANVTAGRDGAVTNAGNAAKTSETEQHRHNEARDAVTKNVTKSVTAKKEKGPPSSLSLSHTLSLTSPPSSEKKESPSASDEAGTTPIPFTVKQMLESLKQGGGDRVLIAPFDQRLASPLTLVIRNLAAVDVGLEDLRLTGDWIGAGGLDWMEDGVGLPWLAAVGHLADAVAKARQWDKGGRKPLRKAQETYGDTDNLPEITPPAEWLAARREAKKAAAAKGAAQ